MNNRELNRMSAHKGKTCVDCGRGYPETVLDLEGFIHHGRPVRCVDTKSCKKYVKKNGKR